MSVCRALALSSAGQKGTYESGVIYGFMEKGDHEQLGWDVISGTSAGALVAGTIGMWPKDKGMEMARNLANLID